MYGPTRDGDRIRESCMKAVGIRCRQFGISVVAFRAVWSKETSARVVHGRMDHWICTLRQLSQTEIRSQRPKSMGSIYLNANV